jgi:lipopolysaccharide/colanic/teichoic acid biosynthesis glycosyltransferase
MKLETKTARPVPASRPQREHAARTAPRVTSRPASNPLDFTRNILQEELFLGMLCLERKRAERSGDKFTLILLDARPALKTASAHDVLRRITKAADKARRDTDIAGWYKDHAVLGIIFTELRDTEESGTNETLRNKIQRSLAAELTAEELELVHVSLHTFADDSDEQDSNHDQSNPAFHPDLFHRNQSKKLPMLVKRCMDIVGSAAALIILSPVFAAIAIAIKLGSKGPILFKQDRIGQFGKPFPFLKFRSMYVANNSDAHKAYVQSLIAGSKEAPTGQQGEQKVAFKIKNDPRVTGIGRFIRRTSLDELPQFWNVLVGQMSLVGPRPPIAYEVEAYYIWHRRRVLEAKPGITGMWQVYGRSRTTFDDMVRLDLQYSEKWTPLLDIKILLQTPGAVFSGDGAY